MVFLDAIRGRTAVLERMAVPWVRFVSLEPGDDCRRRLMVEAALFSLGLVCTRKVLLTSFTGFKRTADLLFVTFFNSLGYLRAISFSSFSFSSSSSSSDQSTD
jgi:hypothetical protein